MLAMLGMVMVGSLTGPSVIRGLIIAGMGLILAIDIDGSSATIAKDCMEQGILVNSIQPGTLRFIPPLIVSQKNIDTLIRVLAKSLVKLS